MHSGMCAIKVTTVLLEEVLDCRATRFGDVDELERPPLAVRHAA